MIERIGTVELTSPSGDSVTIREILHQVERERYSTSDDLYTAIIGNLDEAFIRRKYYDDRGGTAFGTVAERDSTVSF